MKYYPESFLEGETPEMIAYTRWQYVALAQQEALLRYPDDAEALQWKTEIAFYFAQSGLSEAAGQAFANLLGYLLNSEELSPDQIASWISDHTPVYVRPPHAMTMNFGLDVPKFERVNVAASDEAYLAQISARSEGGMCILVVHQQNGYLSFVLGSAFPTIQVQRDEAWCEAADVTGDGYDELIVSRYSGGHIGATYTQVFEADRFPPHVLPFNVTGESDVQSKITIKAVQIDDQTQLVFDEDFGNCYFDWGFDISSHYAWNGEWFDLVEGQYKFQTPGNYFYVDYCAKAVDDYAHRVKSANAVQIFQGILLNMPKMLAEDLLPDVYDELRIKYGFYQAFAGDIDAAKSSFAEIVSAPITITSTWIVPAQTILDVFQTPTDVYRACQATRICAPNYSVWFSPSERPACVDVQPCDPQLALKYLIDQVPFTAYPALAEKLKSYGVSVIASGLYDMDGDRQTEGWLVVRQSPSDPLELWVVMPFANGLKGLFIGEVLNTHPAISRLTSLDGNSIVQVNDHLTFAIRWHPGTQEPFAIALKPEYVDSNADLAREEFYALQEALLSGSDPRDVQSSLLNMQQSPGFTCHPNPYDEVGFCPKFLYTLGLASELIGDEPTALTAYLTLWRRYPADPYTIMARSKLELK